MTGTGQMDRKTCDELWRLWRLKLEWEKKNGFRGPMPLTLPDWRVVFRGGGCE